MKLIGFVDKVDKLGRVVLPMELRKNFSINENDPLEIYVDEGQIVLQKYQPECQECGETEEIIEGKSVILCKGCISSLAESL